MARSQLPENLKNFRIHMVGIKGTGMAALAELLKGRGAIITGSDVAETFYTDAILQRAGIKVFSPFSASNIGKSVQLVIHSSAYNRDTHPELLAATSRSIPCLLYTDALGELSAMYYSCGISGVHGKTTTTAISGTIVKALSLPATVLTGSAVSTFNDSCTLVLGNRFFIAETCEYQRHFLSFHPKKILLTSVESDHQDCFPTYESILSAFMQYIDKLPQFGELIYCADDPGACEAAKMMFSSRPDMIFTAYGEKANGPYRLHIKGIRKEKLVFTLDGYTGEFHLSVPGRHNARNAAGAIALAVSLLAEEKRTITSSDLALLRQALDSFKGSKRRCEIIGEAGGVIVIDDYAHHPTAIKTTLEGLKEFYPDRRLVVDFMSHTYSRTASLLEEFASSFAASDELILHKIYASAREQYDGTVDGKTLYEAARKKIKKCSYFEEVLDAREYVAKTLKPGDLLVTMGAGDNWRLGTAFLEDRTIQ